MIALWAAKGGAGTTVVAAALGLIFGRKEPAGAVLIDLAGDALAVLGLPEPTSVGLSAWLTTDETNRLPIHQIANDAAPGLRVVPRGDGPLGTKGSRAAIELLEAGHARVIVDCGTQPTGFAAEVVRTAGRSILVTRPCYLALRHALSVDLRPTHVVVVSEPGRVLRRADVERVTGAPVVADIEVSASVARAVDAGLLGHPDLPRSLTRALRGVTDPATSAASPPEGSGDV